MEIIAQIFFIMFAAIGIFHTFAYAIHGLRCAYDDLLGRDRLTKELVDAWETNRTV